MGAPNLGGGDNISERQLSWGLWFVGHRVLLKRIGYGVLMVGAAGAWAYTLWGLVDHFTIGGPRLQRAIQRDLAVRVNERAAILQRQRPKPLEIAEVHLIPNGRASSDARVGASYDVAARIVNRNQRWLVRAAYVLEVPGAPDEILRTTLLPGRERWLTRLHAESQANPTTATLRFTSLDWERLSHLEVRNVEAFIGERLNVEAMRSVFVPPAELTLGTGTPPSGSALTTARVRISRVTFTAVNRSAYGLRNAEFTVLLRRSAAPIAVNRVVLDELPAGSERAVAATWFHPLGLVQSVEVVPYVDVFDPQSFLEL